jgi:hypothetical protein
VASDERQILALKLEKDPDFLAEREARLGAVPLALRAEQPFDRVVVCAGVRHRRESPP